MAEEKRLPAKIEVARYLLSQGSLFVHLDPRMDGVVVPKWYRAEPQLVLQIGFDMPVPIPDLQVDSEGIYGTLSFNRSPFTCNVQWDAVFALAGDDGARKPEQAVLSEVLEAGDPVAVGRSWHYGYDLDGIVALPADGSVAAVRVPRADNGRGWACAFR